ncbi:MAG TPA: tRNA (adenosine(37)-N6)-dimethylallyltransferase MiaA [Bacteroidales bacterium]|nr:tRNA (adenosine(37)-N6)-dimethylallyltransferase MiaA [Bacteroidales bacterium]
MTNNEIQYDLLVITGATASGKTAIAAQVASRLNGEIISADSRQVYRRMDIGTGKDLKDYIVDGKPVPVHLLDIAEPGYKYNVFEYQRDFLKVYSDLKRRDVFPVVCGGSGMYIDSIISGYRLLEVPPDHALRQELEGRTLGELTRILGEYKTLHNVTDIDTPKRAIRAIEIERYYRSSGVSAKSFPELKTLVTGILYDRDSRRRRISGRLGERLANGMIEEVRKLKEEGIGSESLIYYGLEYKYITYYLDGRIGYDEMVRTLETEIHRFAKRQMTWFRGMERKGIKIHWIDGNLPVDQKSDLILNLLKKVITS